MTEIERERPDKNSRVRLKEEKKDVVKVREKGKRNREIDKA